MLSSIEQSILSSRLAKLGLNKSGDRAEGEQATPLEDRVNCETIHKKFNRTSCYLCKHGYSSNKKEERKKSNLKSCSLFAVKEKRKLIYHSSLYQMPRAINDFRLLSVCHLRAFGDLRVAWCEIAIPLSPLFLLRRALLLTRFSFRGERETRVTGTGRNPRIVHFC